MYSILLVEDEIIELETLKNYVDWEKIGIDKVYTARGSRSALACMAKYEPDILLSDIQMPGMSGIELAKLIREEGYTCKIAFLTGYDKFEYAKAAVQIHAEDYLLKPFQIEEVEQLMLRIVEKIRQERQAECAAEAMLGKAFEDLCLGRVDEVPSIL
ncbi:MAG: response regulator [Blautia sp.]